MIAPPTGVIPIVVTPFDDSGAIDLDQFDRQIELMISAGSAWIGFGYGSEVPLLSSAEQEALVRRALTVGMGSINVIGNAAVTSAAAGADEIHRVAETGAHAAMVRPTGMTGLASELVADSIAAAATRGELPIVVQDAPQNTGADLPATVLARLLADVPEIVAVKVESPSAAAKIGAVSEALTRSLGDPPGSGTPSSALYSRARSQHALLGGVGGQDYFHELLRGADGTMPGPAFPEVFREIHRRHADGDLNGAFTVFTRILPLINLSLRDPSTFLATQKHLLTRRKVLNGRALRSPQAPVDLHLFDEIDNLVNYVGLWELIDECAPA